MNCSKTAVLAFVLASSLWASMTAAAPPVRLTTDGRQKDLPVFTAGGKEIVYSAEEKFDQLMLMKLTLATGKTERLHPTANTSEFGAVFSADSRRYAYIRNDGNLHVAIVIRDLDSGSEASHNPGSGFAGVRMLDLSRDGRRVAFALPETGFEQQIFTLDSEAKNRQTLTAGGGFDCFPRFSPDGQQLVFASTRGGNFDIYLMPAAVSDKPGSGILQLTDSESLDTHPCWSPDGRQIAFTSLRDGNYEVYLMRADGSNQRRLTDHPDRDDLPCWHPDGKHVLTVSERDGQCDLYLHAVD